MEFRKNQPMDDFTKIAVLDNAIEAQLIVSILTDLDIPHRIRSYHDTALDGLYQVQKGWGNIEAPLSYQTEIIQILNEIRINPQQTGQPDLK
jgi:hypothetical protein